MTTRQRAVLGWAAFLSVVFCFGNAHAQASEDGVQKSREHFDRGVEYVHDGDLRAALVEFKRAYIASPNYRVLYNLGQVSNELRDYTEAQDYFRRYLADGGSDIDGVRRREVEALLEKLVSRIASLVLSTNIPGAELFVDDVSVGKSPLTDPVQVSAGTRIVSAAVSGRPRVTQVVEAAGGDTLVVKLQFPPPPRSEVASESRLTARPQVDENGSTAAVWLGIGSGALAVATGVMAYLAARDAAEYHDAVGRRTTARELDALDERATAKALVTDVLLGATVIATTATLIVALSGGSDERAADNPDWGTASLSLGVGSVGLSGSFQ